MVLKFVIYFHFQVKAFDDYVTLHNGTSYLVTLYSEVTRDVVIVSYYYYNNRKSDWKHL